MKVVLLWTLSILISCSSVAKNADPEGIPVRAILDLQSPKEFEFLSEALEKKKIVQLGESIHMTHEQPLARMGLIRFLNENKDFDVLAFEGSTLDFWVAMDAFLQSSKTPADFVAFRKSAFFGLWQTKEMEQISTLALSTLSSEKPLYMTSFDIQPGIGFGFRKRNPFAELINAIKTYDVPIANAEGQAAVSVLSSLQGCSHNGFPRSAEEKTSALKAISKLEKWVAVAQPIVKKKYPKIPHAEALSLVPYSLKHTIELCDAHQKNTDATDKWAVYQPRRDELNAEVAAQILSKVSRQLRIISWAHHSHVNYNTLTRVRMTFGQALQSRFGDAVFTLGVFAREGTALVGQDEPELKELRPVLDSELDTYLSKLSKQSFFADLKSAEAKKLELFNRPATLRIEGVGLWKAQLAKDYDALIYLDKVTPPQVDFTPL